MLQHSGLTENLNQKAAHQTPAMVVVPPMWTFSLIPAPPVTTRVPEVVEVDPVLVESLRLPAMIAASVPAYTSFVLVAL